MNIAENQKGSSQWLQQDCGEVLVFKHYSRISSSYCSTFSPVFRKAKVLTKRKTLIKIYLVKLFITAPWNSKLHRPNGTD